MPYEGKGGRCREGENGRGGGLGSSGATILGYETTRVAASKRDQPAKARMMAAEA